MLLDKAARLLVIVVVVVVGSGGVGWSVNASPPSLPRHLTQEGCQGRAGSAMEAHSGFKRCHITTVCLGLVIMSLQCLVSEVPLPALPVWRGTVLVGVRCY
ncbi:hypothetical protein E2C01_013175 [Portunus trituberculatus]|uniref:Uncharacterized protein n=1 Tax=Portunus trituberculatus TaxID=210409 RepID=A0A5B7DFX8_PORTR|nr:hypothetical protein [Portunus trituberculatus]